MLSFVVICPNLSVFLNFGVIHSKKPPPSVHTPRPPPPPPPPPPPGAKKKGLLDLIMRYSGFNKLG
jgi:hypothetical protein